jgi:hypothetical protein
MPASRGRKKLAPPSRARPRFTNTSENLAAVEAIRTSQASASEQPKPAAIPPTAARTGFGRFQIERIVSLNSGSRAPSALLGDGSEGFVVSLAERRSAPVQNAPPAPASTTTRIWSSAPLPAGPR